MKKIYSCPIRLARPNGVRKIQVQDPTSFVARRAHRIEWETRILSTTTHLIEKGWKLAFFTLTYGTSKGYNYENIHFNDNLVPKLPLELFKSLEDYKETPCFDSTHISTFIHLLRDYFTDSFDRKVSVNELFQWAIFCEYGTDPSGTHRPHYHGIILFDPRLIEPQLLWSKMREYWEGSKYGFHGFFAPHNFNGGAFSGTYEKPFLAESGTATAKYAAKYACKDLDFLNTQKDLNIYKPSDCPFQGGRLSEDWNPLCDYPNMYRRYFPFHKQSRMFGSCLLDGADTERKIDLLSRGVHIVGENKNRSCPKYIERKILKDYYSYKDECGKRHVKCRASQFHRDNLERIYEIALYRKSKFISDSVLNLSTTLSTNQSFFVDNLDKFEDISKAQVVWARQVRSAMHFYAHHDEKEIAQFLLCYKGVHPRWCRLVPPSLAYLNKYLSYEEFCNPDGSFTPYGSNVFDYPQLDEEYYKMMDYGTELLLDTIYGNSIASDWQLEDEVVSKRLSYRTKDMLFFKCK